MKFECIYCKMLLFYEEYNSIIELVELNIKLFK